MKNLAFILLAMTSLLCSSAHSWDSDRLRQHITIELWPDGAPTDNGVDYAHLSDENNRDIKPQMHVFLPDGEQPHRSVIICPGGAYGGLAMYHEGFEWVDFFVSQDIAAIVLLYRLPHGHHSVPSEDVYEAIRQAQAHAGEWHLSPSQIGIMGSSAGGHLASTIATHAPSSLRPSFQILLYPAAWVSGPGKTEQWETLLRARAIENGLFVAGVSSCDEQRIGNSRVYGPDGTLIAAGEEGEELITCEIDIQEIERVRTSTPSLKHRRPDCY